MRNSALILDTTSNQESVLVDILSSLNLDSHRFTDFDTFYPALSNHKPELILLQTERSLNTEVADILNHPVYKEHHPLLILFGLNETSGENRIALINKGFDGFLCLRDSAEYNAKYLGSLLRIRSKAASNLVDGEIFQLLFQTMFSAYALHEIIVNEGGRPTNYRYLEVNPAFERITGFNAEEVVGKTLLDLFPDTDPKVIEKYGEVALNNEKLQFEQFSEEHKKYFEIIAFSPKSGQFATIFTDVTEYKEALELVKKSEAQLKELNETKDKFFSIVSHDLKNPFHHILGFVEVLHTDYNEYSEEEKKSLIEEIKNSTESAYGLLINLLEWSRMQLNRIELKAEKIDLQKLVSIELDNQKHQANAKGVLIENELEEELFAYADMNMICTVIRNLISNAIKFTPGGGKISIDGNFLPQFTTLSIADTGIGIEEERLKNLFKLKTNQSTLGTAKEKGTGLGLNLCKEFIEKNNGKIWAESKVGHGSRFHILLPKQKVTK